MHFAFFFFLHPMFLQQDFSISQLDWSALEKFGWIFDPYMQGS